MSLEKSIKTFPKKPGVYLFKGKDSKVLYVGKAKNLSRRVKSYFAKGKDERPQIKFLLKRTATIDFIVTDTEKEALLLENTLIKENRPRYNISLRDDKSYISIKIDISHKSPGISLTRKIKKDGALYFGPYSSGLAAREAIDAITRYFRVRSCSDTEFANRARPCLKFDIGRCTAPCVGKVVKVEYDAQVEQTRLFLTGNSAELIKILKTRMEDASRKFEYEDAARMRDVIAKLKGLTEKQTVVKHLGGSHDAVAIVVGGKSAIACVLSVRAGSLIGKKIFNLNEAAGDESKLIEEFLLQNYQDKVKIPERIFVSTASDSLAFIEGILSERRESDVELKIPSRGDMLRLVELAKKNADEALARAKKGKTLDVVLESLGRKLKMKDVPHVIECVDISNLSGCEAVGSIVYFVNGEPDKTNYRIYNIRTLDTPDDYGMMREVLSRRYRISPSPLPALSKVEGKGEGRDGGGHERPLPDLLLVDGGKGQLNVAVGVVKDLGVDLSVAAIAKGDDKNKTDQIFIPGRLNPLKFKRGSKELLMLMKIRDEAHRFGIGAHRKRKSKTLLT